VLPFDSGNAFASLRHLQWNNSIPDGTTDWVVYHERTMCRFSDSVVNTQMPNLATDKPPLPPRSDGSIWALCPSGSPARRLIDQADERTWGGPRGDFNFQLSRAQVFSRRKEDLLAFANLMGPIANKDLKWFDWPAPPDAVDLSLQQELEARLKAISD